MFSESEPDDFCIEVSLFAARTDQGLVDSSGSLRSKITRSLGRKFGTNVVRSETLSFIVYLLENPAGYPRIQQNEG